MSRYLIDRIEATPNIELLPHTEITELHGEAPAGLSGVTLARPARPASTQRCALRHVFLFVGAEPETDWLEGCGVALDAHGFVLTGSGGAARRRARAARVERARRVRGRRRALGLGQARRRRDRRRRGGGGADPQASVRQHDHGLTWPDAPPAV